MQTIKPKVLLSCLNWGLGHATRCIPVIRALIKIGVDVTVAAEGGGKKILQLYFPKIRFTEIPGIHIKYPRKGNMALSMLAQMPGIISSIRKEHDCLEKLINEYRFTHIISDNRYGLYSNHVKTAFICHQVNIMTPFPFTFSQPLLKYIHKKRIEKFDELWIPDSESDDNLSGDLSSHHHISIPVKHLGYLSRFTSSVNSLDKKYDFIALLSGPEPQRSMLEESLTQQLKLSGKKSLLVRGKPDENTSMTDGNLEIISSVNDEQFIRFLHPDTCLISRPGYSTLMDLAVLKHRNLVFIPTPGQTEQEYLAERLKTKYGVMIVNQTEPVDLSKPGFMSNPLPEPQTSKIQLVLKSFLGIEDPA